jgi:hypothetical protein
MEFAMKTGVASVESDENKHSELPQYHFGDPAFQTEFDALTDPEDRFDYITAFKAFSRPVPEETITLEEMKALLGIE